MRASRLFTNDALKLISEASQGTPRIINNLCFNALSLCRALNSKQVDGTMVSEVIADLQLTPQSREPIVAVDEIEAKQPKESKRQRKQATRLLQTMGSSSRVLLVMCVLGILGLTELRAPQSRKTDRSPLLESKGSSQRQSRRPLRPSTSQNHRQLSPHRSTKPI